MSTPYSEIYNIFYSKVQLLLNDTETIDDVLPPDLVKQFFIESINRCYLELSLDFTLDDNTEQIIEDLNKSEITLLGNLMYEQYLKRENDKYIKIGNTVGRDFYINTGSISKNVFNTYQTVKAENAETIEKMKIFDME